MATRTSQASGGFRADDADTWGLGSGVYPATTDDIIIAAGHNITLKEDNEVAYFQQQGSSGNESTLTLGSNTLTINSRNSSNSRVIVVGNEHCNIAANTGKIKLTGSADASHKLVGLQHFADELHDLEVHTSGSNPQYRQEGAVTINGDFTITAGGWTTNTSNHALTVDGATTIGDGSSSADTATLTCNASTISLGSGVTGAHSLVIQAGGTFVGGTGTHTLGSLNIKNSTAAKCTLTSGNTTINGEHGSSSKAINIEGSNGTTNFAHGSGTLIITFNGSSDIKADGVTLNLNNLTINHADADINTKSNLTCAGDVTITAGILDGEDDAISFGSLEIQSGGTYNATSGTTIIKGALRNVGGTIS